MLVLDLGKWMNKILIDWGIDPEVADRFDETIIAILSLRPRRSGRTRRVPARGCRCHRCR